MDGVDIALGGVVLIPLIIGLIQFAKRLIKNVHPSVWLGLSMVFGVGGWVVNARVLMGVWPQTFEEIVNVVVLGLAFGLASSKAYDETLKKL